MGSSDRDTLIRYCAELRTRSAQVRATSDELIVASRQLAARTEPLLERIARICADGHGAAFAEAYSLGTAQIPAARPDFWPS